ncbi:beta-phosphoglucomutase family hydrolase [Ornithinimicrobium humiphilum]|uniref:Putative hydrolase of the HAD superfamily n=1 Tax=Ornithinimicrobium humiphilum TaxID=125288 RepID=A0A543KQE4_9MICO|nr:HAD family hydrolase [Ornithinimicrobium humiphilum]TQM97292.1 putative hydrolase of the HAD superfamily [Ornithinimicrobium humiphilum]
MAAPATGALRSCPASGLATPAGGPTPVALPAGPVRGLLLDLDDTLLGTREAMVRAGAQAAARLWPTADPGRVAEAGSRFREDPGGYFRAYTRGELDFATMRALRLADLARWLGVEPSADDARRWEQLYEEAFAGALRAFDDAVPALEAACRAGLAVGVLTNSSEPYTRLKLRVTGLDGAVERLSPVVVTKDTLGIGKPAPEVFAHACSLLGLEPEEVVYVGDELDVDVCGALAAGLGAAWLRRTGYDRVETDVEHATGHGLAACGTLLEVVEMLSRGPGFGSEEGSG